MSVRPLRPLDVVALASLQRRGEAREITAHNWPAVDPGSPRVPFLSLVSAALTRQPGGGRAWVADQGGRVAAFAVARPRAAGFAWDVERLQAVPGAEPMLTDLLERAVTCAGKHAARRVFLETHSTAPALEAARRAGFERYTSSTLFMLPPGFKVERTDAFEARPRLRSDAHGLFQLYVAAVPATVRSAEALTQEEWEGLARGPRRWQPSFVGSRQQHVWELGASLVGWMQVVFGQRSQFLELLVHPRYDEATDRLLRFALLQVSPKAPVYLAAREYQVALTSALERAGFHAVEHHDLFVRLLAARVKEPRLVPANLVRA